MYYYDYTTVGPTNAESVDLVGLFGSLSSGMAIWMGVAAVLSIVGGILLYNLFVKKSDTPKGKFLKWLKDFLTFKIMWTEVILKVVYYIATIFVILFSFTFIAMGGYGVLIWLMALIVGPIFVRLFYELMLMFIMIWHNTRDIAENTKKK